MSSQEPVVKCDSVYKIFGENAEKLLKSSNGNVDAQEFQELLETLLFESEEHSCLNKSSNIRYPGVGTLHRGKPNFQEPKKAIKGVFEKQKKKTDPQFHHC